MGKSNWKSAANTGDPQVNVLNQLQVHEEYHADHDLKLRLILIVASIQLLVTFIQLWKKYHQAQTLKIKKSIADLNVV